MLPYNAQTLSEKYHVIIQYSDMGVWESLGVFLLSRGRKLSVAWNRLLNEELPNIDLSLNVLGVKWAEYVAHVEEIHTK